MIFAKLIKPRYEWRLVEASPEENSVTSSNFADGFPIDDVLAFFVKRVRQGAPISEAALRLVAEGVERHIKNNDCNPWPIVGANGGRPISERPSDDVLVKSAEVQFYRRFLPDFDGRKPLKQQALAVQFDVSVRMIRTWENLPIPMFDDWNRTPRKLSAHFVFNRRIQELMDVEGIGKDCYFSGLVSPYNVKIVRASEMLDFMDEGDENSLV